MDTGLHKTLRMGFDEALLRVPVALKGEGFGVLTEIDVKSTLKQKLGVDTHRYSILGACNPPFAHQALQIDLEAGLMMPCNVAVYEADDGVVHVAAVDPTRSARAMGNELLVELALAVKAKLERAIAALD